MVESIIVKVRKLLARTEENGCTPEEAETAFAMVNRLLTEHNLSIETVMKTGEVGPEPWSECVVDTVCRHNLKHSYLYQIITKFFFVEMIGKPVERQSGRYDKKLTIFGKRSNVEVARDTYKALDAAFDRLWNEYQHRNKLSGRERDYYWRGLHVGYTSKLQAERDAVISENNVKTGTTGTALAIQDIKAKVVAKFKEHYPSTTKPRSLGMKTGSEKTYQDGIQHGKNLNLNRSVGGRATKAIG
jgi:hypothetical protein